jgi:hypothetical protein
MGALLRILDPRAADGVDGCEPSASVDGMTTLERVVRTVAGVAAAMRGPLAGVAGAMTVRQREQGTDSIPVVFWVSERLRPDEAQGSIFS